MASNDVGVVSASDGDAGLLSGSWQLQLRKSDKISPILKILGAGWALCFAADMLGEVVTIDQFLQPRATESSAGADADADADADAGADANTNTNSGTQVDGGADGAKGWWILYGQWPPHRHFALSKLTIEWSH